MEIITPQEVAMLSLLLKKLMTIHSTVRGMDRDILYKGNILLSPSS
jgi:hypothetical protein